MLYLNFEDDRLLRIRTSELDLVLRAHEELYPEFALQKKYLFFDEVQNAPPLWSHLPATSWRLHGGSGRLCTRSARALRKN